MVKRNDVAFLQTSKGLLILLAAFKTSISPQVLSLLLCSPSGANSESFYIPHPNTFVLSFLTHHSLTVINLKLHILHHSQLLNLQHMYSEADGSRMKNCLYCWASFPKADRDYRSGRKKKQTQ